MTTGRVTYHLNHGVHPPALIGEDGGGTGCCGTIWTRAWATPS